jgi:energy-coupling factor transporter ATP-binding protein EcfA2
MRLSAITGIVGRDAELGQLSTALEKQRPTVLIGREGIGKRTLLNAAATIADEQHLPHAWIRSGNAKHVLLEFAQECHVLFGLSLPVDVFQALPKQTKDRAQRQGFLEWKDLYRPLSRLTIPKLSDVLILSLRQAPLQKRLTVLIEDINTPPTQRALFEELFKVAHVVAAVDSKCVLKNQLKPILHQFQTELEVRPLSIDSCKEIAHHWLVANAQRVRFKNDRAQRRFITHIAQNSNGVPLAIELLLEQATTADEIDLKQVREFAHESGVQYFDMTPLVFLVAIFFFALRYVSRGVDSTEMMVLSGVMSSIIIGFFYFMRYLRPPTQR